MNEYKKKKRENPVEDKSSWMESAKAAYQSAARSGYIGDRAKVTQEGKDRKALEKKKRNW